MLLAVGGPVFCATPVYANGPVAAYDLAPTSITDTLGTHSGQVAALVVKDQTGKQNDPSKYVQFGLPAGQMYAGYRSYFLPTNVPSASVTTITLIANVLAPSSTDDAWNWGIYNWTTGDWDPLGNQNRCGGTTGLHPCAADGKSFADWKWIQYNTLNPRANYINTSTGEIRIQVASGNSSSYVDIDYEQVSVYSNSGMRRMLWQPPTTIRWQYQLEVNADDAKDYPSTNGINVDICAVPFTGGACVEPQVYDIDFNVDSVITGNDLYEFNTAAVQSIHDAGRFAIGYMVAGDAEDWRADFEQYIDFDNACNGCLIGKPFSKIFPNEYWANINNDHGQADFMREMVQARTDKIASTGFDAVEYDVVNAFENSTGFHISYATQVAYNKSIAAIAHGDDLSAPLKSDVDQARNRALQKAFDFVRDFNLYDQPWLPCR
jgi:hypothetical protein